MHVSRQQRRAVARSRAKHTVSQSNARSRASRRIALKTKWRERHSQRFTALQKLALIVELIFVASGGPLVDAFYKGGWFFDKVSPRKESNET